MWVFRNAKFYIFKHTIFMVNQIPIDGYQSSHSFDGTQIHKSGKCLFSRRSRFNFFGIFRLPLRAWKFHTSIDLIELITEYLILSFISNSFELKVSLYLYKSYSLGLRCSKYFTFYFHIHCFHANQNLPRCIFVWICENIISSSSFAWKINWGFFRFHKSSDKETTFERGPR